MEGISLAAKKAIVTGASRGIGRAIALGMARAGADVVLVSRKQAALAGVAAEIEEIGQRALVVPCNMGRPEQVEAMVETVLESWGVPDILVNNAGTNPVMGPLTTVSLAAWDKIMDVNLKGPYLASIQVAKAMMEAKRPGKIINISSTAGIEPAQMLGAYSISKAALNHLTRVLAQELGPANICVNAIAPGLVETDFSAALINSPTIFQSVIAKTPLGRHAKPEEIVPLALYLASSASDFVTGQVIVIDGGATIA
jgi:Dehydrogenases with different specificities (related to short-chain alcohol dehydrogenases)